MARNFKFPNPDDYKPADPAVFCPAERVLNLYKQGSGDEAKRIAKKVRTWFRDQARQAGWAGTYFLPEVQSNHGAGCVLWRTQGQLVLDDQSDASDEVDWDLE